MVTHQGLVFFGSGTGAGTGVVETLLLNTYVDAAAAHHFQIGRGKAAALEVHGEFGLHSNVTNYKIKLLSKYTTDADFGAKPLYTTAHNDKGAVAATSPNQVQEHEYDNPNPGGGGAASTFDDVIQFDSGMLSDDLYVSVEANAGGALIAADKVKIALVWR